MTILDKNRRNKQAWKRSSISREKAVRAELKLNLNCVETKNTKTKRIYVQRTILLKLREMLEFRFWVGRVPWGVNYVATVNSTARAWVGETALAEAEGTSNGDIFKLNERTAT